MVPQLNLIDKIAKTVENPRRTIRLVNAIAYQHLPNKKFETQDFMDKDWDNLLILDACRFDLFQSENTIDGVLEYKYSEASSTVDFLYSNIDGKDLTDTVYVTANGQIQNHKDNLDIRFHDIIPLYSDEWNEEYGTVLPQQVTEHALKAEQKYPNKRLLLHYVQPHFPFIGADTKEDKHRVSDSQFDMPFWERVRTGKADLSEQELWDAYKKTLKYALPHINEAVDSLEGKSVVTSDHGNLFGERIWPIPIREWGHPSNLQHEALQKVPWLIRNNGTRKRIVAEPPDDLDLQPDPAVVENRLRDLGYK
jgi:hypothetical protein